MKKYTILTFVFWIQHLYLLSQTLVFTGKILDQHSQKPVPFAHIGIPQQGIGTISNEAGNFLFKIPQSYSQDTLYISYIGYETHKIPLRQAHKIFRNPVYLQPSNTELNEVLIEAQSARSIVAEAIRRIPENYDFGSLNYTIYIKEGKYVGPNKALACLTEVVFDMYYPAQAKNASFRINKVRHQSFNKEGKILLDRQRKIFIWATESSEFRPYAPYFSRKRQFKKYTFKLEDIQYAPLQQDTLYIISAFKSHKEPEYRLHIHSTDFAFSYIKNTWNEKGFYDRYEEEFFQKINQKWYLQRVYDFISRKAGVLLPQAPDTLLETHIETVITQIDKTPRERYEKTGEDMGNFVENIKNFVTSFNDDFWEDYNVVPLDTTAYFISPESENMHHELVSEKEKTSWTPQKVRHEGKYSIEFPHLLSDSSHTISEKAGTKIQVEQYFSKQEEELFGRLVEAHYYSLACYHFPSTTPTESKILDHITQSVIQQWKINPTEMDIRNIEKHGYPGKQILGEDEGILMHIELYQVRNSVYCLLVARPDEAPEEEKVKAFIESFQILE